MRNDYIIETLTSVHIQGIVKIGGKVIEIYEGVIYRENFQSISFLIKLDKVFEVRQKYKDKNKDVLQLLVKLILNISYGEQLRNDIEKSYECKPENWMLPEYD